MARKDVRTEVGWGDGSNVEVFLRAFRLTWMKLMASSFSKKLPMEFGSGLGKSCASCSLVAVVAAVRSREPNLRPSDRTRRLNSEIARSTEDTFIL
jgi:hypothetical protein